MLFSLAIRVILSAIKEAVKNPKKKAELKKVLLELRDAITELYSDDNSGTGPGNGKVKDIN